MKKYQFYPLLLLSIFFVFASCSDDDNVTNSCNDILGTWELTKINGTYTDNNETFSINPQDAGYEYYYLHFNEDMTCVEEIKQSGNDQISKYNYTYDPDREVIIVDGGEIKYSISSCILTTTFQTELFQRTVELSNEFEKKE